MTIINTSIEIDSPPEQVRAVVLDFARMHEWHTDFLKKMVPLPKGKTPLEMKAGDDMYLKFLQVGSTVKCVENSPQALRWEGGPAMLFHGIHSLEFEALNDGKRTKFVNGEVFTGVFGQGAGLPGIKGRVESLYHGYNRDLKRKCEAGSKQETVAGTE